MVIKCCPYCLRTDRVEFMPDVSAYVTIVREGEEESAEEGPHAVYYFGCCGRKMVVTAEPDSE